MKRKRRGASAVNNARFAGVVELAYTRDLSPRAARIEGSTPSARTNEALTWILIGKLPPASNARQCQAAKDMWLSGKRLSKYKEAK